MNVYQSLNHPWITGVPSKSPLVSGLTIKLSFKANQAMERLFTLLIITKSMLDNGYLVEKKEQPIIDSIQLKTSLEFVEKENKLKNLAEINRRQSKNYIAEIKNARLAMTKQVRYVLNSIVSPSCETKEKRFSLQSKIQINNPRFKISLLKSKAKNEKF